MSLLNSTAKPAIIANPVSGAGKGRELAHNLAAWLKGEGVEASVAFTEAPGHGQSLAEGFLQQGCTLLIAIGGDGAVQEVVNAMCAAPPPGARDVALAILPCGKGNDFARALALPPRWRDWREMLRRGNVRRVDVGRVGGRIFTTVATMGFDAEVGELVNASKLPLPGAVLYPLLAIRHIFRYEPKRLRLSGDFGVIEGPILLTAVGNTAYYGGGMKVIPPADPFDGLLDVCHAEPMAKFSVLRLLPTVYWGGHIGNAKVRLERTRSLRIESLDDPIWIYADGERIRQTPAAIESIPKALPVVVQATS